METPSKLIIQPDIQIPNIPKFQEPEIVPTNDIPEIIDGTYPEIDSLYPEIKSLEIPDVFITKIPDVFIKIYKNGMPSS